MILGAFFILVFPIILVFRFRDLVDEWRSPSSSRDATNSDSSTSGVLDVGGAIAVTPTVAALTVVAAATSL
jgi:hypothetical protein